MNQIFKRARNSNGFRTRGLDQVVGPSTPAHPFLGDLEISIACQGNFMEFRVTRMQMCVMMFIMANWNHLENFKLLGLSEIDWKKLRQFKTIWDNLRQFENIWDNLRTIETIWEHWRPFGNIWYHLKPLGTIQDHLVPFEKFWAIVHGPPLSNDYHFPLSNIVYYPLMSIFHHCTLSTTVQCPPLSIVHNCKFSIIVHCPPLFTVHY